VNAHPSIQQVCRDYRNEDPHTEHVAALAARLFELTREELGLTNSDKELLLAAARLHDIGHASDAPRHPGKSAEIVMQERPEGMSAARSRLVAGIVRLHSGNPEAALREVRVRTTEGRSRIQRLAALLRIADGLDHSHIQDATITGIRKEKGVFVVSVLSRWYAKNVPWADKKADLWREVMPIGIRLEDQVRGKTRSPSIGIVSPSDHVLDACRRLLMSQYRIIADNRAGALAGDDPEYLHDIRVAVRRFRAALILFRPYLKKSEAAELNARLSELGDDLGPVRDMQVWVDFLEAKKITKRVCGDPAWPAYRAYYEERNAEYLETLRAILDDANYNPLAYQIVRLLKEELPARIRDRRPTPLRPFAAKALRKTFERITKHKKLARDESAEEMHDLRRLCRRERYWSEFLAPALGAPITGLAKRLKKIADSLGDVHDMDLHLAALETQPIEPPAQLAHVMKGLRKRAAKGFRTAWGQLHDKDFKRKVLKKLNRIQNED